jgi:hypothetical protein
VTTDSSSAEDFVISYEDDWIGKIWTQIQVPIQDITYELNKTRYHWSDWWEAIINFILLSISDNKWTFLRTEYTAFDKWKCYYLRQIVP